MKSVAYDNHLVLLTKTGMPGTGLPIEPRRFSIHLNEAQVTTCKFDKIEIRLIQSDIKSHSIIGLIFMH